MQGKGLTSLEAERATLGAMLIDKEAICLGIEHLKTSRLFSQEKHKKIYDVLIELYENGEGCDPITVSEELDKRKMLQSVGGAAYITELFNETPSTKHIEHYCDILWDRYQRREIQKATSNLAMDDTQNDPEETTENLIKKLESIQEAKAGIKFESVFDGFEQLDEIIESAEQKGRPDGYLRTGFAQLDDMINYIAPTDFILVTAATGVGKTTFVLQMAEFIADKEGPVLIYTGEMHSYEVAMKLVAKTANIPIDNMLKGRMTAKQKENYRKAVSMLGSRDLHIITNNNPTLNEFKAAVRRAKRELGIKCVVLDYIQLIKNSGQQKEVEFLNNLSGELMEITNRQELPMIAISRQNKAGGTYGSSEFDYDCNYHISIGADTQEDDEGIARDTGIRWVGVKKARLARGGAVKMEFQGEYSRFIESGAEKYNEKERY